VAVLAREDDYVAYLYPTIDGQPANATPRDASGNAYLVLTSDSLEPELAIAPVARNLRPGDHTLHLIADRGFDRWALAGFAVSSGDLSVPYTNQIKIAWIAAAVAGLSTLVSGWFVPWRRLFKPLIGIWDRLGDATQLIISVITALALMLGMLLTWGDAVPNLFRREPVQLGLSIITAGLIYVQPGLILTVLAALILFIIFYHRLDLGLTLIIFFAPFFLFPIELYRFAFPISELLTLIAAAAWIARSLANWGRSRQASVSQIPTQSLFSGWHKLDYAVVAWLLLAIISLTWADLRGFAVTELRTLILEPALFYAIFRTTRLDKRALVRLIDALMLAGFAVAVIGLIQFARGESIITAEEGARRLASVYGSPNNVGLFIGRCLPFALAYLLIPVDRLRRLMAGVVLAVMLLAAALSLSAGAIFIGIPTAVAAVFLLVWGKRARIPLAGIAFVGVAGTIIALQSARFARLLDFTQGTNFYRIRVWQSALNIIKDHPITGLGLDQFLYAFRGHYIFPDAWQEPDLSHPHNFILDFWVRLGIAGVVVFLYIQFAFWRTILPVYRHFRETDSVYFALTVGTIGSMVNLLAHGMVDNSVYVLDLTYVFVLLLGSAVALFEHQSY
jgi:O-antigen ligase